MNKLLKNKDKIDDRVGKEVSNHDKDNKISSVKNKGNEASNQVSNQVSAIVKKEVGGRVIEILHYCELIVWYISLFLLIPESI